MARVGIVGGENFIVPHIVRKLRGRATVSVFDMQKKKKGSISLLFRFLSGKDTVIHAAVVNRGSAEEVIEGTVGATLSILKAVSKMKRSPNIIFLSSIQAEGGSVYGASKWLAEALLEDYARVSGARVIALRIANEFGEGCRPFYNSVIATFSHQLAKGERLSVNPNPKKFNFVYAGDIAKVAAAEVLKKGKGFSVKVVESKHLATVAEVAKILSSFAAGKKPKKGSKFEKDLYTTYRSYIKKHE